jgi:N-acetylglucosaminyldiphosphoundecaprenol N-acetyl-beta-D-mannosaminyltransferase
MSIITVATIAQTEPQDGDCRVIGAPRAVASCGLANQSGLTDWRDRPFAEAATTLKEPDDLSRNVYCVFGIPVDAIEMATVVTSIEVAAVNKAPFVISTFNLNYLVTGLLEPEFRESLSLSDLCTADGMPIVWIAQLLGIPVKKRVAGSDIFDALKARPEFQQQLSVFLFGDSQDATAAVSRKLNEKRTALSCVGWISPGYGTVEELSQDHFVDKINSSNADFLVVALSAKKGVSWVQRNHHRLRIPIRANFGATIKFQAGVIERAPYIMRKFGLEWLWRIKEEPYLWNRYWRDGAVLLRLLLTHVLPLAISVRWLQLRRKHNGNYLLIESTHDSDAVTLSLSGYAVAEHVDEAISCFKHALSTRKRIIIDFAKTRAIDARFFGLLLMLRKQLKARGAVPKMVNISPRSERLFRLHALGYLLSSGVD